MSALDDPVELAETALIFRRALARRPGLVVDADTPAPVFARPDVATALPVAAWGTRSSVGVDQGAPARKSVPARPAGPAPHPPK